jgi:multicomponent Na+:H+ antiporter subunit A
MAPAMLAALALSPFFVTPAALWLGKHARWAALLSLWPAALAVLFARMMQTVRVSSPVSISIPWAPSLGVLLSFYADGLSLFFAILISSIGSLIVLFSAGYFRGDPRAGAFLAMLFAFMGSMLGLVLADNLFALYVFWELTGFTSFLLIGFEYDRSEARRSALQAWIVTATGGMGLLAAAVLLQLASGSPTISVLMSNHVDVRGSAAYPWIAVLILFAAFTKSAQTPFHFWLPNAMAAPTPVSAYLHSATMVKAGLYLVARMTPVLGGTIVWTALTVAAGTVTMILGAWRSIQETDLKRVLAYSTMSALGLIMMGLGIGTQAALQAAFVFLFAHACYKGALFLVAGTLDHETGTRNVMELGGLGRHMPATAVAGILAACSMAGLPLFVGFVGKELLYDALLQLRHSRAWVLPLLALAVTASALLGAAGLIAGLSPFTGSLRRRAPLHEASRSLVVPPLLLGIGGFVAGLYPGIIDIPLSLTLSSVSRALSVHLAVWHGFSSVLLLSLLTLAGVIALYVWRDPIRERMWPRALGFERLYTGTLRLLDTISAWIIPALQSASLRAYVMVLIVTAATLVAGVLVLAGLPPIRPLHDMEPAEAAVALMTIAGAISAARARATITAALSLGITGYGVALIFLFFGAPDLAITQFSVETLTAVIFTLVFYHFRRFRSLSSGFIRARDFAVAVLFGASITAILLFVGTTRTPFGLGEYFADNSVTLGHGHNIVNVILVDFRAMDTMGEITVLASAALGVRALLRIGKRDEDEP